MHKLLFVFSIDASHLTIGYFIFYISINSFFIGGGFLPGIQHLLLSNSQGQRYFLGVIGVIWVLILGDWLGFLNCWLFKCPIEHLFNHTPSTFGKDILFLCHHLGVSDTCKLGRYFKFLNGTGFDSTAECLKQWILLGLINIHLAMLWNCLEQRCHFVIVAGL